ncbi:hypothetical protein DPMN_071810 [Dreissena polymorpha]|uniref:Uncharacterized protein n=1 Tax=Dreissena polymorpha TaxID=45954 RepID=A0A9D3Z7A9_DREPO|nr:hypothetical protein DPMN_071810 [Dreissena polymorpha]
MVTTNQTHLSSMVTTNQTHLSSMVTTNQTHLSRMVTTNQTHILLGTRVAKVRSVCTNNCPDRSV